MTLLEHARSAATSAGYDPYEYDLDIVRNNPVPGWNFSGTSSVGSRNLWLQATHLGLTVHELGHNLGLNHSGRWNAEDGGVVGPGTHVPYENDFDTMGQPNSNPFPYHFNVFWKNRIHWLPDPNVLNIQSGGLHRLWAYDIDQLDAGRSYALRFQASPVRDYWMEFRQAFSNNPHTELGILFNLGPRTGSLGDTQLLDMTPDSSGGVEDAPLVVGRTFSDWDSGFHVTPVSTGEAFGKRWADVRIHLGNDPSNQIPIVSLAAPETETEVDSGLHFSAAASDGDGDSLAYHWDFGDGTFGTNGPSASHSWDAQGEYLVRCSVTDMRGGTASDSRIVRIGAPETLRIEGTITENGLPIENVRVSVSGSVITHTTSDGRYALVGLQSGNYTVTAVSPGRTITELGFSNPVAVGPSSLSSIDFVSTLKPPAFETNPESQTANKGDDISFYVQVSGAPPVLYQWRHNGLDIPDAKSAALSISNVSGGHAGDYSVLAWNSAGTNTSSIASLTIKSPPTITAHPDNVMVNIGESAAFSVAATGNRPFFYQWLFNETNFISGASTSTYSIPSVDLSHAGAYSVMVANADGLTISSDAILTVNQVPVPPAPTLERMAAQGVKVTSAEFLGVDPDGDTVSLDSVGPLSANGGSVIQSSGWVIYSPPHGFVSEDSFAFSISDGRGGMSTGTATVTVLSQDIIPDNFQIEVLSNGDVRLTFDGIPERTYSVEYTEQLNPPLWQHLGQEAANASGRFSYIDSPPTDSPNRYYRSTYP